MEKISRYCVNCSGKGHVLDGFASMIPFWGQLLALVERNDPQGFTRKPCTLCGGTGLCKNSP